MGTIRKSSTLILVLIFAASTLTILQSATAQSTPTPSVPEFTVKYADLSYNTQAIYGIDQYTGKTVVKEESYHVDNRSLQFTIKNQPFTSFTDPSSNQTGLYYNFSAPEFTVTFADHLQNFESSPNFIFAHR